MKLILCDRVLGDLQEGDEKKTVAGGERPYRGRRTWTSC